MESCAPTSVGSQSPAVAVAPRRSTRARAGRAALAVGVLAFALDLTRPPAAQWSARAELALVDAYRARLSPWIGAAGVRCRFEPSCSLYARGAILKSGGLVGPFRAGWRVARCGPWTKAGTLDPP